MELVEREGDHTEDERAELHDGEANAFDSVHLDMRWSDHERRVLLVDRGRIIACAGLVVADVEVEGDTFGVVGFGGVIVTHTRRGEGLGRRVMDAAIERARELGPDRGLLFCREDRSGFYRGLGFADVDEPVEVAQPGTRRQMPLRTMWRPLRRGAGWPRGPVSLPGLPF
jgi:predicted N-acetyltransferase YhbS